MNKKIIKEQLLSTLNQEIKQIEEIAQSSKDYANSDSVKSDGKYDTRGVEAGYLAGAQFKRLEELKLEKKLITDMHYRDFKAGEKVAIGALVDIRFNNLVKKYFIASTAGGSMLKIGKDIILVISVFSPIGAEVVGLSVGDDFEVEVNGSSRHYEILGIS